MRRRNLIALLGGATIAWPLAARGQQATMPVVGFLGSSTLGDAAKTAFRKGLDEAGYFEGRNVTIDYRFAPGQYDRLAALAAELVSGKVAVIVAGGLPAALAAKAATSTIPIVIVIGADPIQFGLVASLGRPGGNVTGVVNLFGTLGPKRLELLRELVPAPTTIAILSNPNNPNARSHLDELRAAARAVGQRIDIFSAGSEGEIDAAFAAMVQAAAGALLVADDPFYNDRRQQIVTLAARHRLPAIHFRSDYVAAGGLISYGPNNLDNFRLSGVYAGRILAGAKPADLPVLQPTTFELVVNMKTAKALGLTVPESILVRADEVIE